MNWIIWFRMGALSGFLGVLLGAFGAHAAKKYLGDHELEIYKLACSYILWHTAALLALGALATRIDSRWVTASGICFSLGLLLFSGSLFLLSFSWLPRSYGFITPIGGALLLAGWILMVCATIFT